MNNDNEFITFGMKFIVPENIPLDIAKREVDNLMKILMFFAILILIIVFLFLVGLKYSGHISVLQFLVITMVMPIVGSSIIDSVVFFITKKYVSRYSMRVEMLSKK